MEQWAADCAASGEQFGVRCLAQGSHLSRGHFLPEPGFKPTTLGYPKSNALSIRPRLPLKAQLIGNLIHKWNITETFNVGIVTSSHPGCTWLSNAISQTICMYFTRWLVYTTSLVWFCTISVTFRGGVKVWSFTRNPTNLHPCKICKIFHKSHKFVQVSSNSHKCTPLSNMYKLPCDRVGLSSFRRMQSELY